MKVRNGCEQDSPEPDRWAIGDWSWQRCPIKLITPQTQDYLRAYNLLQLGITPHNCGWMRESNKFIEAMQVIGVEVRKVEAEFRKQEKK